MQSCRLRRAGLRMSTSCVLQRFLGTTFILYMWTMGVSAFTTQSEEHIVATDNCQFRGKLYKTEYRMEGEPVILRCPLVSPSLEANASAHTLLTWRKNNSAQLIPGEESRMWIEDGALWFLPALLEDSGTYICTVRNASHCEELKIFENTEASLPLISYLQFITQSTSGVLVCPDLKDFLSHKTDAKIQWYKDSVPLAQDNEKFQSVGGTTHLLLTDASMEDAGYYKCTMTFAHRGREYNVTRNIELLIKKRKEETIPVIISPLETIPASLGSRLTVPCKVFLGANTDPTIFVCWMANNTLVPFTYPGGRLTQGMNWEYSENNENYIEAPLIFDPVTKEDLNTDFKCIVFNQRTSQTQYATLKEASSTFSWQIALAPLPLVILVLGGIWIYKWYKHRAEKHMV
uniref:Interleukin-1 receptor type 2 n=1 Tax=Castor canadensis TaxID=51338 RepID=A0A250YHJ8_CASCN